MKETDICVSLKLPFLDQGKYSNSYDNLNKG